MLKPLFIVLTASMLGAGSQADVIINEIHYDPDVKTELVEFIELHNTGTAAVDVSGWSFTSGVQFTFPPGTSISGGGYLVISQNPTQFAMKYGANAYGPWTGSLSNEGEEIQLRDTTGYTVDSVD